MAQRIVAELKAVVVVWKGVQKNEKTGKLYPVVQIEMTSDDGRKSVVYVQGQEELEKVAVGEKVNLLCSIRAWKDQVYLNCLSWIKVVGEEKKVRV